MRYLETYILLINLISIIVCIVDKIKAQRNLWRISEKTLFTLSAIGGALGMYLTMITIRHKTKHVKFMLGIPLIIILQIAIALAVIYLI